MVLPSHNSMRLQQAHERDEVFGRGAVEGGGGYSSEEILEENNRPDPYTSRNRKAPWNSVLSHGISLLACLPQFHHIVLYTLYFLLWKLCLLLPPRRIPPSVPVSPKRIKARDTPRFEEGDLRFSVAFEAPFSYRGSTRCRVRQYELSDRTRRRKIHRKPSRLTHIYRVYRNGQRPVDVKTTCQKKRKRKISTNTHPVGPCSQAAIFVLRSYTLCTRCLGRRRPPTQTVCVFLVKNINDEEEAREERHFWKKKLSPPRYPPFETV